MAPQTPQILDFRALLIGQLQRSCGGDAADSEIPSEFVLGLECFNEAAAVTPQTLESVPGLARFLRELQRGRSDNAAGTAHGVNHRRRGAVASTRPRRS